MFVALLVFFAALFVIALCTLVGTLLLRASNDPEFVQARLLALAVTVMSGIAVVALVCVIQHPSVAEHPQPTYHSHPHYRMGSAGR